MGRRRSYPFSEKKDMFYFKKYTDGTERRTDAVMQHDETLIFVEVKTRKNEDFGRPFSAIDQAKRKKLISRT